MALKNRETNLTYLRLKDGKFYEGKNEQPSGEELEGTIVKMYYKDEEYEGTPLRKLIIVMQDGSEKYQLGLNVESRNYSSLVSFLKNADLTKPLTLHPKSEKRKDGEEGTSNSILVSQNGKFMKGYFTKDNPGGAPQWKQVRVGKKLVTDKSEYLEFLENFVTENYISVIDGNSGTPITKKDVVIKEDVTDDEPVAVTEKLPWED